MKTFSQRSIEEFKKGQYAVTRRTEKGIGYRLCCPTCSKIFTPLNQKVDKDTGVVAGTVKCPANCGFEDQITLIGL